MEDQEEYKLIETVDFAKISTEDKKIIIGERLNYIHPLNLFKIIKDSDIEITKTMLGINLDK